jgi:hypothetical protein
LDIPCNKDIAADGSKLEWRGKSELSISFDESDMGAHLIGEKDTASVNCITYYRPPYSIFRYGSKMLTDVPEIVLDPGNWAVYSIEVKNKTMTFVKNGKILKTLKSNQTLGQLKSIMLHFKGTGKIDWVKLYHKDQLEMEENFNKEGYTTAQWK